MKQVGRIVAFVLAVVAVGVAVAGVLWTTRRSGGGGVSTCSLSSLGSPGEVYLESYIQMHAEELQQPAGNNDTPVVFVVEPGEAAAGVARKLEEAGLVSDAELFRRYLQYEGLDASLEAGTFTLRQTMTIPEVAQALQSGQRPERVLTVREGLRLEEVATEVATQVGIPETEFLALVTAGWRGTELGAYDFLASLPPDATLEGFLLPETYRLPEDATAYDVVARMLLTFSERVTMEMQLAAANRGMTVYDMVTLASIVEREAARADERPVIAGVFLNRLESGWYLNADPTVQYGLGYDESSGTWWRKLYFDALGISALSEIDHLYNTYRYLGLPPGPICSPGLASVEAAAHPAETDYFYFVVNCHTDDGSHLFAVTEEEHLANSASCSGEGP
jgi:UPF0755 protein